MNQTLKDILTRRSIRKFKPDTVSRELIDQVIEAGLYAASGKNQQLTKIIAVTNPTWCDRLRATNRQIGEWKDDFDPFYGAPVILIVLAEKNWRNFLYDGSLVLGNMMLAAHALGLGSCWIHRAKQTFEMPEYQQLLRDLGIEGEWEGIGHLALGHPDQTLSPLARKPNRVHYVE